MLKPGEIPQQQYETLRQPENTDIEVLTTEAFRTMLPDIIRDDIEITFVKDDLKYDGDETVDAKKSSTEKDPAILLYPGAVPCSLVIAYDDHNCKIIHLTQFEKFLELKAYDHEVGMRFNNLQLKEMRQFLPELAENFRVLLTATNISTEFQEAIYEDIRNELGIDEDRLVEILLQSEPMPDTPRPAMGITQDRIHSVAYIPGSYTHDARSKIFILADSQRGMGNRDNMEWLVKDVFRE